LWDFEKKGWKGFDVFDFWQKKIGFEGNWMFILYTCELD